MNSLGSSPMVASFICKSAAAAPKAGTAALAQRCFSANAKVWVDKDTRVICQGLTGKQVRLIIVQERILSTAGERIHYFFFQIEIILWHVVTLSINLYSILIGNISYNASD